MFKKYRHNTLRDRFSFFMTWSVLTGTQTQTAMGINMFIWQWETYVASHNWYSSPAWPRLSLPYMMASASDWPLATHWLTWQNRIYQNLTKYAVFIILRVHRLGPHYLTVACEWQRYKSEASYSKQNLSLFFRDSSSWETPSLVLWARTLHYVTLDSLTFVWRSPGWGQEVNSQISSEGYPHT